MGLLLSNADRCRQVGRRHGVAKAGWRRAGFRRLQLVSPAGGTGSRLTNGDGQRLHAREKEVAGGKPVHTVLATCAGSHRGRDFTGG